ncbi:hypothetical protein H5410_047775 [Solanum commersonii]|uniref:Nucleolar protein 10 n=1 Tax=Solanum commersonii TaxID=4109 RepID=A0A9J5XHZ4_SOLCO|nr:hypothetical protein H5410_047775 [Solanum commersonii]
MEDQKKIQSFSFFGVKKKGDIGEALEKMYLQFYINENGNKVYTTKKRVAHSLIYKTFVLKVAMSLAITVGCVKKSHHWVWTTQSAHPARFSPDDKFSRQRVLLKKRFGLLPTQKPAQKY